MFEPRFYRDQVLAEGLISFEVKVDETDLLICAQHDLATVAYELVRFYHEQLQEFINHCPVFLKSYVPVDVPQSAPEIVKSMAAAAKLVDVGPMAAVAGAVSEYVAKGLLKYSDEVIIENGGDIFIKTNKARKMGIFAGNSPLSNKIAVMIKPEDTPLGICTSSGTIGHSVSFGRADAAVIFSKNTSLADAAATKVGNMVRSKDDIREAIEFAQNISGIDGVIVIADGGFGGWGKLEFAPA